MSLEGYTPEPTDFRIIPLDATLGLPTISLAGFELPFKGISFPTEQRIKTTYYPGNAQASQTVIGPTLPNTTIGGRWMDISRGVSDGDSRTLVRQIEYLVEHAVPVEVQWGGRNFGATSGIDDDPAIVRRGLIKKIDPKYNRLEDIEWTIEFEWSGGNVQSQSPTLSSDVVDQGGDFVDFSDQLGTTVDTTQSWTQTAMNLLGTGANALLAVSDAMDYVQNRCIDAINVIDGASSLLQNIASLPSEIANRVRGVLRPNHSGVRERTRGSRRFLWHVGTGNVNVPQAQTPPGSTNNPLRVEAKRALLAMMPTDDPLDILDKTTALADVIEQWDATAALAARRSAALQSQTLPAVIAIVRPSGRLGPAGPGGAVLRRLDVVGSHRRLPGEQSQQLRGASYSHRPERHRRAAHLHSAPHQHIDCADLALVMTTPPRPGARLSAFPVKRPGWFLRFYVRLRTSRTR